MKNRILKLAAPNEKKWNRTIYEVQFQNKEFFTIRLKAFYTFLKDSQLTIQWKGDDKGVLNKLRKATDDVSLKGVAALKEAQMNFLCGIYAEKENLFEFADMMLTDSTMELAKQLVKQGAVSFANIKKMMGWPEVRERTHWYTGIGEVSEKNWYGTEKLAPIALMCEINTWVADNRESSYYYTMEPYVLCTSRLVEYVYGHRRKEELAAFEETKGFTEFSGADFRGKSSLLQQLVFSGALKPGKLKISAAEPKKLAGYIELADFPGVPAEEKKRYALTLSMLFHIFGSHKEGFTFPATEMPEQEFLRSMYGLLNMQRYEMFSLIFDDKPKHVTNDFYMFKREHIGVMLQLLQQTLVQADRTLPGKWIGIRSLDTVVNLMLAECDVNYLMIDGNSNIKYSSRLNGKPFLPLPLIKGEVHDKIIPGFLKGMALLGGVDLLFDTDGKIVAVRATDLGRWLLGISNEFPAGEYDAAADSTFEIDDATRMVIVKNPEHPYARLISEFAEKVSGDRWRITQASLLKGCASAKELEAKIERLKNFVTAEPGPNVQHLLDTMLGRCNKVCLSEDADSYVLYRVDREDGMLHALIQDSPVIRENTLKVEGCGLLIKKRFLHKFFTLLRGYGYLTDQEY